MNVLESLRKQLRKEMENIADDLALGGANDYSQYAHMTGQIKGLAVAEAHLLEIDKLFEDEEES